MRGRLAGEGRVFGNTAPCQVSPCACQWLGKAGSGLGFVPCSTSLDSCNVAKGCVRMLQRLDHAGISPN